MDNLSVNVRNIVVLLKQLLGETLLYFKTKLDNAWSEYGEIVNVSEISNGIYEIDDVWTESDNEKVPDKKSFLTGDDRSLSVSRDFSKNLI